MPKGLPIPNDRNYTDDDLRRLIREAKAAGDADSAGVLAKMLADRTGPGLDADAGAEETEIQRLTRLREEAAAAGDADSARVLDEKIRAMPNVQCPTLNAQADGDDEGDDGEDSTDEQETSNVDGDGDGGDDIDDDEETGPVNSGEATDAAAKLIAAAFLNIADIPARAPEAKVTKPDVEAYLKAIGE